LVYTLHSTPTVDLKIPDTTLKFPGRSGYHRRWTQNRPKSGEKSFFMAKIIISMGKKFIPLAKKIVSMGKFFFSMGKLWFLAENWGFEAKKIPQPGDDGLRDQLNVAYYPMDDSSFI
jgi:hypothetical protein